MCFPVEFAGKGGRVQRRGVITSEICSFNFAKECVCNH